MDKRELAYAKQTVLAVKDWDAFQNVLRFWSKLRKPEPVQAGSVGVKNT
ncbi:MAG: hypothetical protein WBB19_10915 [Desulforhopalus sp.]